MDRIALSSASLTIRALVTFVPKVVRHPAAVVTKMDAPGQLCWLAAQTNDQADSMCAPLCDSKACDCVVDEGIQMSAIDLLAKT